MLSLNTLMIFLMKPWNFYSFVCYDFTDFSSLYYFPREFLALSPDKIILKPHKKRKLGLEEISYTHQTLWQRETRKLDKRVKSAS